MVREVNPLEGEAVARRQTCQPILFERTDQ
jgi:hypothetical protein